MQGGLRNKYRFETQKEINVTLGLCDIVSWINFAHIAKVIDLFSERIVFLIFLSTVF